MELRLARIIFSLALVALGSICVSAQMGPDPENRETVPKSIREKLQKMRIDEDKKEFDRLVARSEEVSKLTSEIHVSFAEHNKLTDADHKKLRRVEKLLKKIRRELRAGKDKKNNKKPGSMSVAIKNLQEHTKKLFTEIKKTTRHSISALAIQSSNNVLKLVKFLRFKK